MQNNSASFALTELFGMVQDVPESDEVKAKAKKAKELILIIVGIMMFLIFIDLWFISNDGKQRILPYYLEPTDEMKQKEKNSGEVNVVRKESSKVSFASKSDTFKRV